MLLAKYKNGNYDVSIFDNGTKIRENDLDNLTPEFPESIDMKITDFCDKGCLYCHEKSSLMGKHSIFDDSVIKMLKSIKPYTELAIGGGNPLAYPDLVAFLLLCKNAKIIVNLTVNSDHFEERFTFLKSLTRHKLIYGLGVSICDKPSSSLIEKIKKFPNAVVHTIAGVTSMETFETLSNNDLKVLILGFKHYGRGDTYFEKHPEVVENIGALETNLLSLIPKFKVMSFDNLALRQLQVQSKLPEKIWNQFYMGDDGGFTFYIDLVNRKFAKNSTSKDRLDLTEDVTEMFQAFK